MMFRLRFPEDQIAHWANRYTYPSEDRIANEIAPAARERGYLKRTEFVEICKWKTPRSQPLVKANSSDIVEAVTRAALESRIDAVKIVVLQALRGVAWPTASTILHFCDKESYPILDFRALWSLGYAKPPVYTLDFWCDYTRFVRELSQRTGRSMRIVDRALWQYSNERQRNRSRRLTAAAPDSGRSGTVLVASPVGGRRW